MNQDERMADEPLISIVDLLTDGVLVEFSDGTVALFPPAVLKQAAVEQNLFIDQQAAAAEVDLDE